MEPSIIFLVAQKLFDGAYSIACDVFASNIVEGIKKNKNLKQNAIDHQNFGRSQVELSQPLLKSSLLEHLSQCKLWSSNIFFADMNERKETQKVHVELDTFVIPRHLQINAKEIALGKSLKDAINDTNSHVVVLGMPGAGKTTSMKKFCTDFFYDNSILRNQKFPICFRLREPQIHRLENPIYSALQQIFPLSFKWKDSDGLTLFQRQKIEKYTLMAYIDELRPFIILDGLDEIPDVVYRNKVIEEFSEITLFLKKAKIILTCRTGEFRQVFDNVVQYEIAPLSEDQVRQFAKRWLSTQEEADDFCNSVFSGPLSDTAKQPLIVAHLCAIYERVGAIPEKPKTIYKKIIYLLLEEWDQQRGIRRRSKYAFFEIDRKAEFLSALAFRLTSHYGRSIFSRHEISRACSDIARGFKLSIEDVDHAAKEIESHTGLLIQSGFDSFEFSHKSLQEYLTAEYIVRSSGFRRFDKYCERLPIEFAISISISSDPNQYFSAFILDFLQSQRPSEEFLQKFATRLMQENIDFYSSQEACIAMLYIISVGVDPLDVKKYIYDCFGVSAIRWIKELYNSREHQTLNILLEKKNIEEDNFYPKSMVLSHMLVVELGLQKLRF